MPVAVWCVGGGGINDTAFLYILSPPFRVAGRVVPKDLGMLLKMVTPVSLGAKIFFYFLGTHLPLYLSHIWFRLNQKKLQITAL